MEAVCGLGLPELLILALLAFVVIGPERSQEVALQAGRFLRNVLNSEWWGEFNDVARSLRNLPQTLVRMAEIEEAQSEIRETIADINRTTNEYAQPRQSSSRARQEASNPDPWGIANATAQTSYTPRPETEPEDQPQQPEEEDSPDA
ncbi:MAG: hypothetical protein ACFB51_13540 [Anaerolineae bacterium]